MKKVFLNPDDKKALSKILRHNGVSESVFYSKNRDRKVSDCRMLFCLYLDRARPSLSLIDICCLLGFSDKGSVSNHLKNSHIAEIYYSDILKELYMLSNNSTENFVNSIGSAYSDLIIEDFNYLPQL